MKKKTIIIISILLVIITTFICINIFLDNIKFKSEDEIIAVFNSNKQQFYNSAETLSQHKNSHWSLRKNRDKHNEDIGDYWKYETIDGGIQLTIHDEEYFEEINSIKISVESENNIQIILKKHKFKSIGTRIWDDCIYFVKQTTIGFDSGIVYCPTNEVPQEPYITKLTEIEPNWFYYEAE